MEPVNPNINFQLITEALNFYNWRHYRSINTPWAVEEKYVHFTHRGDKFNEIDTDLHLVGSAEQGFIKMMCEEQLEYDNCYVSCTPCFRKEPNIDEIHKYCFMKVELFCLCSHYTNAVNILNYFIRDAMEFFGKHLNKNNLRAIYVSKDSFDIVYTLNNGTDLELGSYSIYQHNNYTWVCGTGLACPRIETAFRG